MFKDAGGGFRIFFDSKNWTIRIMTDENPFFGFLPMWRETASFTTAKDWFASSFADRVNEDTKEDVVWFWIDAE